MVKFRAVLPAVKRALGFISVDMFVERQKGPSWIEFHSPEAREGNNSIHKDYMFRFFNTVVSCSLVRYAKRH